MVRQTSSASANLIYDHLQDFYTFIIWVKYNTTI